MIGDWLLDEAKRIKERYSEHNYALQSWTLQNYFIGALRSMTETLSAEEIKRVLPQYLQALDKADEILRDHT